MFFGVMRSYAHGGENRKPDCQQFQAALRKVLADKNILYGKKGNCTALHPVSSYCSYSNISTISSNRRKKKSLATSEMFTPEKIEDVLKELDEINTKAQNNPESQLTDLSDISTAYIASLIELKIINDKNFKCTLCKNVFAENEKLPRAFTNETHPSIACLSTFEICRNADFFLKLDMLKGQFSFKLFLESIKSSINVDRLFINSEFEEHHHEKITLVEQILYR